MKSIIYLLTIYDLPILLIDLDNSELKSCFHHLVRIH